jgi:hypothetical protein
LQFFHGPGWILPSDPSPGIERLRRLPSAPTVFTSLGDAFTESSCLLSHR